MSNRVSRRTLQSSVAIVGILVAASSLAGCSTFGMGDDHTVTGSTGYQGTSNLNQPMPSSLAQGAQVADNGPYTPPADVGQGAGSYSEPRLPMAGRGYASLPSASAAQTSSFSSQDLPVIGNSSSNGNLPAMSAQPVQQSMAPISSMPKPMAAASNLSVVPAGTYTHVIKNGESLYTIARHYGVTAQAIMQASSISAPDKIFVGQRVVIPGRPDLLAAIDHSHSSPEMEKLPVDSSKPVLAVAPEPLHGPAAAAPSETRVASLGNNDRTIVPLAGRILTTAPESVPTHHTAETRPAPTPLSSPAAVTPLAAAPAAKPAVAAAKPVATASASAAPLKVPTQEPAMSGADKFRWPLTGKVVVSFANSHGTGINIAAPEGTPVKAVENGTVIYVGNGVEGYGNLILIRHANGYVSAYADLKDMKVQKNAVVGRGEVIGSAGATGAVSSPQLHFELRKGATPVDPVPLMAG